MDRKSLTLTLLLAAKIDINSVELVNSYTSYLWAAPISNGMQLTPAGHHFLTDILNLTSYSIAVKHNPNQSLQTLFRLSQYLTSPYYIQSPSVIVFYGESDATILQLMDGDIVEYLKNCAV